MLEKLEAIQKELAATCTKIKDWMDENKNSEELSGMSGEALRRNLSSIQSNVIALRVGIDILHLEELMGIKAGLNGMPFGAIEDQDPVQ